MNSPYLLTALKTGPDIIALTAEQIPSDRLDLSVVEGRFTAREAIAHLADVEQIMRERMRQAVERPGSTILSFDEGERAILHRYSEANLEESLQAFRDGRIETIAYLAALSDEDWDSPATHEARGPFSVIKQAYQMMSHDLYHVEHLLMYRP